MCIVATLHQTLSLQRLFLTNVRSIKEHAAAPLINVGVSFVLSNTTGKVQKIFSKTSSGIGYFITSFDSPRLEITSYDDMVKFTDIITQFFDKIGEFFN